MAGLPALLYNKKNFDGALAFDFFYYIITPSNAQNLRAIAEKLGKKGGNRAVCFGK